MTIRDHLLSLPTVTQHSEDSKFLRTAIKAGLRMQKQEASESSGSGVATLQRIKASLRKRNLHAKGKS